MKISRSQTLSIKLRPLVLPSYFNFSKVQKMQQSQSCPEACQFTTNLQQRLSKKQKPSYIHNLQIDYGKLENFSLLQNKVEQVPSSIDQLIGKSIKVPKINQQENLQTQRVQNISSFTQKSTCQKQTQKKRLKYLKTEITSPNHTTKRSQKLLNLSSITNQTNLKKIRQPSEFKKKQSGKKIEKESRVVKLIVAGGQKKTRLICYPDTSEYQRLCRLS